MSAQKGTGSRKRRLAAPETGPFVLRSLLEDVPLSAEGEKDDIEINCVEFLGEHSYCMVRFSLRHAAFLSINLS
jgi:hypothetical protein